MYAGFDIGGTTARASLYDDDWQLLATTRSGVRGQADPSKVAATAVGLLEEMFRELRRADTTGANEPAGPEDLRAVGLGIAGQLDRAGRLVRNAPNLGWRDEPFADRLVDDLAEDFGTVDVRLVNDLNAALWGEATAGALRDVEDALAVSVGTGVGGAIMTDGCLTVGAGGNAGEIGHSKVESGGRLCGCGERGCVEAYAGGIHLEERVAEAAMSAETDELSVAFTDADVDEVDLDVADELSEDFEAIDAIWREATDYLAMVIANACTLLNPEALLLGGGVLQNAESYRRRLLTKTTPLVLEVSREDLEIRFPELGDEAGMLGAARLAAEQR